MTPVKFLLNTAVVFLLIICAIGAVWAILAGIYLVIKLVGFLPVIALVLFLLSAMIVVSVSS